MALAGIHVVCGRVASRAGATLINSPDWSQTMDAVGTTARAALDGNSMLQVSAAVDAYFAVGPSPNATLASGTGQNSRYYIPAGTTREVFCTNGDYLAWALA